MTKWEFAIFSLMEQKIEKKKYLSLFFLYPF